MILTGEKLTQALRTPVDTVRLLDAEGNFLNNLSAHEAVTLMAQGSHEVGGSVHRVKYLRQLPGPLFLVRRCPAVDSRVFEIDPDFWSGRGMIRYWQDQRTSVGKAA